MAKSKSSSTFALPPTFPQILDYTSRFSKILLSKLWLPLSSTDSTSKALSYGSTVQFLFGNRGALYEKKTLQIGVHFGGLTSVFALFGSSRVCV